jgi:7-cyano-7-deazaguanine synthase
VARKAVRVACAIHAGDHYAYPDCRPGFIETFDQMQKKAVDGFGDPSLCLYAPFVEKTKAQIVELGASLSVPYEETWSCYLGENLHCGLCGTCIERKEAFSLARVSDPTKYRT